MGVCPSHGLWELGKNYTIPLLNPNPGNREKYHKLRSEIAAILFEMFGNFSLLSGVEEHLAIFPIFRDFPCRGGEAGAVKEKWSPNNTIRHTIVTHTFCVLGSSYW